MVILICSFGTSEMIFSKKNILRYLKLGVFFLSLVFFPFFQGCGYSFGFPVPVIFCNNSFLDFRDFHWISVPVNTVMAVLCLVVFLKLKERQKNNPSFLLRLGGGIRGIVLYHIIVYVNIILSITLSYFQVEIENDTIREVFRSYFILPYYFGLYLGFFNSYFKQTTIDLLYMTDPLDVTARLNYIIMIVLFFGSGYLLKKIRGKINFKERSS